MNLCISRERVQSQERVCFYAAAVRALVVGDDAVFQRGLVIGAVRMK